MANFYKKSQFLSGGEEKKKAQSGRSMIEMLGVLAIIGVLSIGGIAAYTKAMEKHNINKLLDQITRIVMQTRTTFADKPNYNDLDGPIASVIVNTALGNEKEVGIKDEYGNYQSFSVGKNHMTSENVFRVDTPYMSQAACMAVLTTDWGEYDQSDGYGGVKLFYDDGDGLDFIQEYPISMERAAEACSGCVNACWISLSFK